MKKNLINSLFLSLIVTIFILFVYVSCEPPSPTPPEPTEIPQPTDEPTPVSTTPPIVTDAPTAEPTPEPTEEPTPVPTPEPTEEPTPVPTAIPTAVPTAIPTAVPTAIPTAVPTDPPAITAVPITAAPSSEPTPEPTPEPIEGAGNVWIVLVSQMVNVNDLFTTEIHINSGSQRIAAYGVDILYDSTILAVNTEISEDGIETGPDGYIAAANIGEAGKVTISGFDVMGVGPSVDFHMCTVNWIAAAGGTSALDLEVRNLADEDTTVIGTPTAIDTEVTVVTK